MKEPALEPGLSGLVPRLAAGSQGDAGPEQGNVVTNSAFSGPPLTVNGTSFPLISLPALFIMDTSYFPCSSSLRELRIGPLRIHSPH